MIFSKSCKYGIQAVIYLSQQSENKLVMIKDISENLKIPSPYLAKIMQILSKHGLLESLKGPKGGFKLGRPSEKIILREIVDCIDGAENYDSCLIGFHKCNDEQSKCSVHNAWSKIKNNLDKSILSKTIEELGKKDIENRAIFESENLAM